jgi:hypothetical protein
MVFIEYRTIFNQSAEQALDFMAALRVSAAISEKESGVLAGVAKSRVARDEAHLAAFCAGSPPERRHQGSQTQTSSTP